MTSSLYGGAAFLAVNSAAPGLSRLEAAFEYGTVAAFHFDLLDHAAVTGCSITIVLFASIEHRQARVAGRDGCVISVVAVEASRLPHRNCLPAS